MDRGKVAGLVEQVGDYRSCAVHLGVHLSGMSLENDAIRVPPHLPRILAHAAARAVGT